MEENYQWLLSQLPAFIWETMCFKEKKQSSSPLGAGLVKLPFSDRAEQYQSSYVKGKHV